MTHGEMRSSRTMTTAHPMTGSSKTNVVYLGVGGLTNSSLDVFCSECKVRNIQTESILACSVYFLCDSTV